MQLEAYAKAQHDIAYVKSPEYDEYEGEGETHVMQPLRGFSLLFLLPRFHNINTTSPSLSPPRTKLGCRERASGPPRAAARAAFGGVELRQAFPEGGEALLFLLRSPPPCRRGV